MHLPHAGAPLSDALIHSKVQFPLRIALSVVCQHIFRMATMQEPIDPCKIPFQLDLHI